MDKLKSLRKKNNVSQTTLAELLNVSQSSYGKYELGKAEPNIQNLKKLASFYNVSVDFLIDYKANQITPTEEQKKILNIFDSATDQEKKQIIAYATGLTNRVYDFGDNN